MGTDRSWPICLERDATCAAGSGHFGEAAAFTASVQWAQPGGYQMARAHAQEKWDPGFKAQRCHTQPHDLGQGSEPLSASALHL